MTLCEPALSASRYSDDGARRVRVRSEGGKIAKGIVGGGQTRYKRGWRVDPRVAAAMLVVVVMRDGNGW